jgi:hypothetical protein
MNAWARWRRRLRYALSIARIWLTVQGLGPEEETWPSVSAT